MPKTINAWIHLYGQGASRIGESRGAEMRSVLPRAGGTEEMRGLWLKYAEIWGGGWTENF